MDAKKSAYAIQGNTAISKNLDHLLALKGETSILPNRPKIYKVINPHKITVQTTAYVYLEFWELIEGVKFDVDVPFETYDIKTGDILPSQVKRIPRAYQVEVFLSMKPEEGKAIGIRLSRKVYEDCVRRNKLIGAEGIADVVSFRG